MNLLTRYERLSFNTDMDSTTYTADAVRAELARKRRTQGDLAAALEMTPHTLGKRLSGQVAFTIPQIVATAAYLDVPLSTFIPAGEASKAAS